MENYFFMKLWHTERQCWIESFSISQTVTAEGKYEHEYFEGINNKLEKLCNAHIREVACTGSLDKNKNWIYDGSLLKPDEDEGESSRYITYNVEEAKYKICISGIEDYWNGLYSEDKEFCIEEDWNDFYSDWSEMEVIGHVYEPKRCAVG